LKCQKRAKNESRVFAHPFDSTFAELTVFFEVHAEAVMKSIPANGGQTRKVVGKRGGGDIALSHRAILAQRELK